MITPSGDLLLAPQDVTVLLRVVRAGLLALDRRNGGVPEQAVRLAGELDRVVRGPHYMSRSGDVSGPDTGPRKGIVALSPVISDNLLSVVEAASVLGVSARHMRRLCHRGIVVARRSAAGAWQVDTASLAARRAA